MASPVVVTWRRLRGPKVHVPPLDVAEAHLILDALEAVPASRTGDRVEDKIRAAIRRAG